MHIQLVALFLAITASYQLNHCINAQAAVIMNTYKTLTTTVTTRPTTTQTQTIPIIRTTTSVRVIDAPRPTPRVTTVTVTVTACPAPIPPPEPLPCGKQKGWCPNGTICQFGAVGQWDYQCVASLDACDSVKNVFGWCPNRQVCQQIGGIFKCAVL